MRSQSGEEMVVGLGRVRVPSGEGVRGGRWVGVPVVGSRVVAV
jgi:hypothetical protein